MKETLKFTPNNARIILDEDSAEYEVIQNELLSYGRWELFFEVVIKRLADDKLFKSEYSRGATESQDVSPWDNEGEAVFNEVSAVQKTITAYE